MSDYGSTPPPPPPPGGGGYDGDSTPPPPPSGGGYGGGAYGAPPPPAGGPQGADHPKGMTILILGILSLVCCSPLGIAAWVMGNKTLKEIDSSPGRYNNRQIVQIGRILGIIGTVLLILTIIWIVFLGGLAVLSGETTTTTGM